MLLCGFYCGHVQTVFSVPVRWQLVSFYGVLVKTSMAEEQSLGRQNVAVGWLSWNNWLISEGWCLSRAHLNSSDTLLLSALYFVLLQAVFWGFSYFVLLQAAFWQWPHGKFWMLISRTGRWFVQPLGGCLQSNSLQFEQPNSFSLHYFEVPKTFSPFLLLSNEYAGVFDVFLAWSWRTLWFWAL